MTQEEKFAHLENWSKSLVSTIEDALPQMREALYGDRELPTGCPSKESLASMIFRQVHKKLDEVNYAVKMVDESISATGSSA